MRSTIKKGPRTVGLKRARSKAFKAKLQAMWDALNKAGFSGPSPDAPSTTQPVCGSPSPCGSACDAASMRKIIKRAQDENVAEWSGLLIRQKVLMPEQSVSLTAAHPPECQG